MDTDAPQKQHVYPSGEFGSAPPGHEITWCDGGPARVPEIKRKLYFLTETNASFLLQDLTVPNIKSISVSEVALL